MKYKNGQTQWVKIVKERSSQILKYDVTDDTVLDKIQHLQPVVRLFEGANNSRSLNEKTRIIFLTENIMLAGQAVGAYMSKKENQKQHFQMEISDEEEDFDDFEEDDFYAEEGPQLTSLEMEKDFLIIDSTMLGAAKEGNSEEQLQVLFPGSIVVDSFTQELLQSMENIIVDCLCGEMNDTLLDKLEVLNKKNIMLVMRGRESDRYYLKRLLFEQNYEIVQLQRPSDEYYINLFREYLSEYSLKKGWRLSEKALYRKLITYRGSLFFENDIQKYIELAEKNARAKNRQELWPEDFKLPGMNEEKEARKKLHSLIGLSKVKEAVERQCTLQLLREEMREKCMTDKTFYRHMAFSGPPGTGKSEVARIWGELMAEEGVSNGRFITARKCDLVGEYVGHTAPKIAELFRKADGGILFIDEAGSLTIDDVFSREAVTELVRYMEERPQTTVIFATYSDTMERFLNLDPGLSSRISKNVIFEPYTDNELICIFGHMAEQYGFLLERGYETQLILYISACRRKKGNSFGNAREMRKLLEQSIEWYSIPFDRKKKSKTDQFQLSCQNIHDAAKELLGGNKQKNRIGFAVSELSV